MLNDCSGKVALVTGAATGIGRACAEALAAAGARLVLTDIDQDALTRSCEALTAQGGQARSAPHDVTEEAAWQDVIAGIKATEGALDVLVNNAGIAVGGALVDMSLDDFRRQNAVNIDGVFLGCKHAIPLMAEAGTGSIINISSVAGLIGASGLAGYSASKGAVRLMSKSVALECADAGLAIRCNSVHPGIIDTDIWGKEIAGIAANAPELLEPGANRLNIDLVAAAVPLGRPGQPANIGSAVTFLASDAAAYINGTELVVDYGLTAR